MPPALSEIPPSEIPQRAGEQGHDRVRAAYGDDAYGRLQALKRNYDPDNAFHRNQNIVPA